MNIVPENNPFIWAAFPYVDIDPLEKYLISEFPTYSNFVVTEGKNPTNTYFKVSFGNSPMVSAWNMEEVWPYEDARTGLATVAMYADQSWDDEETDFDVVFVSNYEGGDIYPVYSREFYFTSVTWSDIFAPSDPIQVSDPGHESSGNQPFLFGPVGTVFDWKNEEVAWTHRDTGPNHYHHIWGDYELN